MSSIEFIRADTSKLEVMAQRVWCDLERPIVACQIEFKLKEKDSWTSGYLMFTRGALYIFRSKMLGKIEFFKKCHLLDMREMTVSPSALAFSMDDGRLFIKSDDALAIAHAMRYVLKEATYGLPQLTDSLMRVESSVPLPEIEITERPVSALKWRALFLAHFYDVKGEQLYTMDYFEKYEGKQTPMLVIGPSLHPGNFAAAYGHAIGWERNLDTVVFQNHAPTKFAQLLDSLVDNAWTIKRIAFTDYSGTRIPKFSGNRIMRSSVVTYMFVRMQMSIIVDFAENTMKYPQIEELLLNKPTSTAEEFTALINALIHPNNSATSGHLRKFELSQCKITNFPTADISRLVQAMPSLQRITLSQLNGGGERFLRAAMRGQPNIKSICCTAMHWKTGVDVTKVKLPPTLLHLDVSNSSFTPEALASILTLITNSTLKYPLVVEMRHMCMKAGAMNAFQMMDLSTCQSSIAEFDFSGNRIADEQSRFLFAFLFTQKKLRLVSFNGINAENPIQFLKYLIQLIQSIGLPGLDLSGNFDKTTFTQFLQALASSGAAGSLRRLNVAGSGAGVAAMGGLDALIKVLPNLNEIVADGFEPENPQALYTLWKTISQHPTICAVDLPKDDMKNLGLLINRTPQEFQALYAKLEQKARPSTTGQRLECAVNMLEKGLEYSATSDIYKIAASMKWVEEVEFETEE